MFENWPNDLRYNTTIIITNDLGDQKGTKTDLLLRGGIPLDRFTIKTTNESGEIVVRLPKKISRVAKFFLYLVLYTASYLQNIIINVPP